MKNAKNEDFTKYYEKGNFIAGSTMADIYYGKDLKTGEPVAIKLTEKSKIESYLRNNNKEPNESNIKEFTKILNNEVKYMTMLYDKEKLNNKNTVLIKDCFNTDKEFVIVMELCDCNLFDYLCDKKELNPEEIYEILNQLNNSFEIMKKNQILHRALRPENILIKYNNKERTEFTVKLKLTEDCCTLHDLTNNLSSLAISENRRTYAPEILEGGKYTKYAQECDLWSIGIIIYFLKFKKYPFNGKTKKDILNQIKNIETIELKKIENSDLNDLFKKLLEIDPRKRITWEKYFEHPFFRKRKDFRKFYEINENKVLGNVDFRVIYEAIDKKTKEKKAIKVISKRRLVDYINRELDTPRPVTEEDMKPYINRFLNEVNHMKILQGSLNENKNTVIFVEYFKTNEEFAIVMELCTDNLSSYITNKEIDIDTIHEILTQLNNSFKIMVENNILHKAIKLENILINYESNNTKKFIIKLKITDDTELKNDSTKIEETKIISDLNIYAPEILNNEIYTDKSELWSLGILIFYLYHKKFPFEGDSIEEKLENIKKGIKINTNYKEFDDLITKLLISDPSKRLSWDEYFNHKFFKVNNKYSDYYEKGKALGTDGFGVIYEAIDKKTKEKKAIKVISKRRLVDYINRELDTSRHVKEEDMKPYINGFLNEVNHMKVLQGMFNENKNTVIFNEYFNTKEEFAIVMELCDDNLLTFINEKKLNFRDIQGILRQLNNSFKIMVENNILHRAIKLENILVKKEQNENIFKLKLTDDNCLANDTKPLNEDRILKYRVIYAPEVLRKERYTEFSDLWSLGILIYYLYFKSYPFEGENEDEVLKNIDKGIIQSLTPNSDFNDLIYNLLKKDSSERMTWEEYFNHDFIVKQIYNQKK